MINYVLVSFHHFRFFIFQLQKIERCLGILESPKHIIVFLGLIKMASVQLARDQHGFILLVISYEDNVQPIYFNRFPYFSKELKASWKQSQEVAKSVIKRWLKSEWEIDVTEIFELIDQLCKQIDQELRQNYINPNKDTNPYNEPNQFQKYD